MKWFFLTALLFIGNLTLLSQVDAGPDQTICIGETTTLQGTGPTGWDYTWTSVPVDPSISNPNILTPTIQPASVAVYVYTLTGTTTSTTNLVTNGDFESGNTAFTSSYDYCNTNNCLNSSPPNGKYGVHNDPNFLHNGFPANCGDHTSGSGNMMVVNGAETANTTLYEITVNNITPNTGYEFSTWLANMSDVVLPQSRPDLQFEIDGQVIGNLPAPTSKCSWIEFSAIWNSGSSNSATIRIIDQTTVPSGWGNDFAIDDVALYEKIEDNDNCTVTVLDIATSTFTLPSQICINDTAVITYTGNAPPPPTASYHWNFGPDAVIYSGSDQGPYSVQWSSPGTKTVFLWVDSDCDSDTTFINIQVNQNPDISITADATSIPYGTNTTLYGNMSGNPGPLQFTWEPAFMLTNPANQNPTTVILENDIYYFFEVTDQTTNCASIDSILIQITGGAFSILSAVGTPDTICPGETTNLHVNLIGGSGNYSAAWTSNPPGYSNTGLSVDANPLSTTMYLIEVSDGFNTLHDSIEIVVLQQTAIINQPQNEQLLVGSTAQFTVDADFANDYQWQISTDGGSNWNDLTNTTEYSGAFSHTLIINPIDIGMNGNLFQCLISGKCNNITSDEATLTVITSPNFIGGLENTSVCVNDTFSIACNVSNFLQIVDFNLSIEYNVSKIKYLGINNIAPEIASNTIATTVGNTISVSWNSSQDVTITDGNLFQLTFVALEAGTSSLSWNHQLSSVTNGIGQQPTMILTDGEIIINPLAIEPSVAFSDKDTVNIIDIVNINLGAEGGLGDKLIWSANSCNGDTIGMGSPLEILRPEQTTSYYAYWLNQCGKSACAQIQIVILYDYNVGIPNAFTPNGDGLNDEFKVVTNSVLSNFTMQIYNRWGQLIFETNNQSKGWDGTYKGKKLISDSFVWKISYRYSDDGTNFFDTSKTGAVMLLN